MARIYLDSAFGTQSHVGGEVHSVETAKGGLGDQRKETFSLNSLSSPLPRYGGQCHPLGWGEREGLNVPMKR